MLCFNLRLHYFLKRQAFFIEQGRSFCPIKLFYHFWNGFAQSYPIIIIITQVNNSTCVIIVLHHVQSGKVSIIANRIKLTLQSVQITFKLNRFIIRGYFDCNKNIGRVKCSKIEIRQKNQFTFHPQGDALVQCLILLHTMKMIYRIGPDLRAGKYKF